MEVSSLINTIHDKESLIIPDEEKFYKLATFQYLLYSLVIHKKMLCNLYPGTDSTAQQ